MCVSFPNAVYTYLHSQVMGNKENSLNDGLVGDIWKFGSWVFM